MDERERPAFKLSIASKIVTVVERLEKRGYEFDRSNTLDIMSLFAELELFEKSTDLEETWCDDEEFVSKLKEIMVNSSLSLHDLIRLRPEEAAKQLKHKNYIELANKLSDLPESYQEACAVHLCEIISRGFFWPWALDAFYELQRYQLPILCCEMIIANLQNEDLYNICLYPDYWHPYFHRQKLVMALYEYLRAYIFMFECIRTYSQLTARWAQPSPGGVDDFTFGAVLAGQG
ncbi:unnamed protein product [Trichogramma brassicae]|uniref:Uncharacterized protein n=1 Tax=Trichogramma brassicae TaxID=86971 RepID=A0A6H5IZV2_9HYME|nr:unnamed protein product [Trichogramma brassicae]